MALEDYFHLGSVIFEAPQSHTQTRASNRTLSNEWSAHRRGRTYTKHNKHEKRTTMPSAGFEAAIPAMKRIRNYALDRTVTGIHGPFQYHIVLSSFHRFHVCNIVLTDFRKLNYAALVTAVTAFREYQVT